VVDMSAVAWAMGILSMWSVVACLLGVVVGRVARLRDLNSGLN
jgi:hypothetical protein